MNTITFSIDNYGGSKQKLFEAVGKQLALLLENEYVCKVYDDDVDIIVMQFNHDEHKDYWGCETLEWITPDELEFIERLREGEDNTIKQNKQGE